MSGETNLIEAVTRGVSETLESMFFMTVTDCELVDALPSGKEWCFFMPLESAFSRGVTLKLPEECIHQMADFLFQGQEVDLNEVAADIAGEFLNMICGRMMANLAQSSGEYTLHLVEAGDFDPETQGPYKVLKFETDESRFFLKLLLKQRRG